MTVEDDVAADAARALTAAFQWLAKATPGGHATLGRDGSLLAVTGARVPTLNGILATGVAPDAEAVATLATQVPDGLPWSIATRGTPSADVCAIGDRHGLTSQVTVPLMVLSRDRLTGGDPARAGIRVAGPDDVPLIAAVIAAGFEAPPEIFGAMLTEPVITGAGARTYLLTVDGTPTSTGLSWQQDNRFGLFNVATPPAHRRCGYATAVTKRMLTDGFRAGADYAYLQPSESSRPLYEKLGFTTVESWTYLVSDPA